MLVNVIADISAGFRTDGKASLQRNTVRSLMSAVSKAKYENCTLRFFAWSEGLAEFVDTDEINFSHRADVSSLEEFIQEEEDGSRFLLLSDGLFDGGNLNEILRAKRAVLVPVAVGADSDIDELKQIAAPNSYCFKCVNVLAALFEVCFRDFYGGGTK